MKTISLFFCTGVLVGVSWACGKKEEKKTANVATSLKSTGIKSLGLSRLNLADGGTFTVRSNSSVTVESFQIPIGRINLTAGDNGSGYSEASPNLYGCPGTTNEECMVDIVKTDINDLLKSNAGSQSIEIEDTKSYTGTAVEICAEGQGGPGTSFKAKLKASGTLGGVTYYTNATSGASTTGPAEFVEITLACGGINTDLLTPVTLGPDQDVSVTFWAEPTGGIALTNSLLNMDPTSGVISVSGCTNTTSAQVGFCAGKPSIFGTATAGSPTISRYLMEVASLDDGSTGSYAPILATILYDGTGASFGANLKQVYDDTPDQNKLLHASKFDLGGVTESSGFLAFKYMKDASTESTILSNLPKDGSGSSVRITDLVDKAATLTSSKL